MKKKSGEHPLAAAMIITCAAMIANSCIAAFICDVFTTGLADIFILLGQM